MTLPDPVSQAVAAEVAKRLAAAVWHAVKRSLARVFRRGRGKQRAPETTAPASEAERGPGPSIRQDIRAHDRSQVIAPMIGDVTLGPRPDDKDPQP